MVTIFLVLGAALCVGASPREPLFPKPATGIFGRVVNSQTHEPVRRAAIKVYNRQREWNEITDVEGRFRFPDLEQDEYNLAAHRDDYTDRFYIVERSDFDAQKELPIELVPQGIVMGKAVDSLGQPLQSAQVQALGPRSRGGPLEVVATTQTNDLGEYRLAGLDAGAYQLRVTYHEGGEELDPTPRTTATVLYGGSGNPTKITVGPGLVVTGIDFVLNPVLPAKVSGMLRTESSLLPERASVWIEGSAGQGGHSGNCEEGKFSFEDVSPGGYTISAHTTGEDSPLFGLTTVTVGDADLDGIELVMRPMPKVDGEIRLEGGGAAALEIGEIFFSGTDRSIGLNVQSAKPDQTGRFTVALAPGEYVINFYNQALQASVKSIEYDGKPIDNLKLKIDESPGTKPLVIVVGSRPRP